MTREALELSRKIESALKHTHLLSAMALEYSEGRHSGHNNSLLFYERVRHFEIVLIQSALEYTRGSQVAAARLLQLKPTTLHQKIKAYNIAVSDFK
jgi:DNA-binding NtrC family response regulator